MTSLPHEIDKERAPSRGRSISRVAAEAAHHRALERVREALPLAHFVDVAEVASRSGIRAVGALVAELESLGELYRHPRNRRLIIRAACFQRGFCGPVLAIFSGGKAL